MKKTTVILLICFLLSSFIGNAQWATVWKEDFNGYNYEYCYPTQASAYWADCSTNPRNSLINGNWEVTNTVLGSTQVPADNLGGRFLMYWSQTIKPPNSDDVIFSKTLTILPGKTYRFSFKYGGFNSISNAALSVRIHNTTFSTTLNATTGWQSSGYYTWAASATQTSVTITLSNSNKNSNGNDFGIDDLLFETAGFNISGTVLNDANGMTDLLVNGVGTNASNSLFVKLVNGSTVEKVAAVSANGTFSFSDVVLNNYKLVLANNNTTAADAVLSPDWVNTGEVKGNGTGHDGSIDGIYIIGSVTANVINVKFGINRIPSAVEKNYTLQSTSASLQTMPLSTGGNANSGAVPGSLTGSDPEDGNYVFMGGVSFSARITSLPTVGYLTYNGVTVTQNMLLNNVNAGSLSLMIATAGHLATTFSYSVIDAAGTESAPVTYTISWLTILPIELKQFNAVATGNAVILSWNAINVTNGDRFELLHSNDGVNYSSIGAIPVAAGYNELMYYQYRHITSSVQNYYRLKMVDLDGVYNYGRIIHHTIKHISADVKIHPNPVTNVVYISGIKEKSTVKIFTNSGSLVKTLMVNNSETGISMDSFASGLYMVWVEVNGTLVYQGKLVKM